VRCEELGQKLHLVAARYILRQRGVLPGEAYSGRFAKQEDDAMLHATPVGTALRVFGPSFIV